MKRWFTLVSGWIGLSVMIGCGGTKTGLEGEMLRPFSGEALINSTIQPVKWSGGDAAGNVDILFVPQEGQPTVLSGNLPNNGEAEVRVDLLSFAARQGGSVQVVPTNGTIDGSMNGSPSAEAIAQVAVSVGSLAAFSWSGNAEEYWWMNVHNGDKQLVGTVGDMQSWAMNTLAVDHTLERIYIVGFDPTGAQKVYSLHAKTGVLLADFLVTGISVNLAGVLLTRSGMLLGFAWDSASASEKMFSLDPQTGVAAEIGVVGDLQFWQTETVYSSTTDEVYVAGITASDEHKLYVMNATTGAFVRSVPFTHNGMPIQSLLGLASNSVGDIIGYRWNGSSEQMMRIDPATGVAVELGSVGDLQFWSTVADVNLTNDRAYVIGTNSANENKLYTLDMQTGTLLDEIVVSDYPTNAVLVH